MLPAAPSAPGVPPTAFSPAADQSLHNQRLSGKAELEYKPEENTLLYASVSEGVKSGGFASYNVPNAPSVLPVKPEVLWAYEAGFKSSFANDTLQLNGSAFYYDYKDQQVQGAICAGAYGAIGSLVNAKKSHLYGGELEADWEPTSNWKITQALGWKDGKFDQYSQLDVPTCQASGAASYISEKGKRVGFPPLSYNGSVAYQLELPGYVLEPEVDYAFHDHLNPLLLGPVYYVKSYWLANANLTLTPDNQPWSVAIFGHNIFNQKYDTTRNFFLTDIDIAQRGEPATVGVRLSLKY